MSVRREDDLERLEEPVAERVARLRRAFDEAFAAPVPVVPPRVDLLLLRAGGAALALRVRDVTAVEARRAVVALPGAAPTCLGLAGVRGRVVAVHGLARLLGRAAGPAAGPEDVETRWLAVCGDLALAFAELEGRASVPSAALTPVPAGASSPVHADALVSTGPDPGDVRPVLDVGSLRAATAAPEATRERSP